ncbi:CCA tRNA nucleotidyltransferase [Paenibacillus polymyxa]|uniref:CCA tRNA nucleotidyltransferase n=1 Tax=Paenibacillus polymyxa TaxID=1406 RepID=UPI0001E6D6BB|nr:CCA tRNA nucleotidyltransferase [Paenibacillus polymyxa]WPQ59870.1 CCA tRNA nucleotidyltransferase [Paenibacillus polymyxa]
MSTHHVLIIEKLMEKGFEAVYVGGCVRDKLRGAAPDDYNIATNATPEQITEIFDSSLIDEVEKNVGVMLVDGIDVATYRSDIYHKAGKPEVKLVGTFFQDSTRRDFTINAMAETVDGTIIDHHKGRQDLNKKLIRAVWNPLHRFIEDPSRILRGMYLAAKLSFTIEKRTLQAMKDSVRLLETIPNERIAKILRKVMKNNCLHRFMELLMETGALKYVFPELIHTVGMSQNIKCNGYDHILRVVKAVEKRYSGDTILQLAALFQDMRATTHEGEPHDLRLEESAITLADQALVIENIQNTEMIKKRLIKGQDIFVKFQTA